MAAGAPSSSNSPGISRWLVSTEWLASRLRQPDLVVVDGSYYLPTMKRDATAEYLAGHIPGAVFFDIDAIKDHSNPLPHMLPTPEQFTASVGTLGIGNENTIIVYDGVGLYGAARVWWTFRAFGARHVFVLDGGLPKWKAEGRPLETAQVPRGPRTFNAPENPDFVASLDDVKNALSSGRAQVVDARAADRFRGEAPEPRPGLRSGHMPGSFNVPYQALLKDGRLASPQNIAAAFDAGGVDLDKPIITSCGSGVTAAILTFALDALGKPTGKVYDGSWSEWGMQNGPPVATGPA